MRVTVLATAILMLTGCGRADVQLADGAGLRFEDWRGSWVFINYWAEWCAPCRHEIPELNALHLADNGAIVVGVNYDGIRDQALLDLMQKMGIQFLQLNHDPYAQLHYARPTRLPTTYVLDPDGQLVQTLEGPQTQAVLERIAGIQTLL